MKRMMMAVMCMVLVSAAAGAATYEAPLAVRKQADAKVTAGPKATPVEKGIEIAFEVSAPVDVEVAVLNTKGEIVRHLAAGLLGEHAPSPFRKGTLKQTLLWDGKDDAGRNQLGKDGARFSVRVRIGASPKLVKVLGRDNRRIDRVSGLGVSPKGEVFVLNICGDRGSNDLRVYDRDGRYLRTILPYSAGTPAERTKSVGQIEVEGRSIPVVFNGHAHALSPLTVGMPEQNMAWNPKGHLVAVSTYATLFEHGLPRHLLAFHPQGGAPKDVDFVGPQLRPPTGITWGWPAATKLVRDHIACSPDGKYIYYTHSSYRNRHAVFRLYWGEDIDEGMEAGFLGKDSRPGSDDEHLSDPLGVAVDSDGNIYVCDHGNQRVMIYSNYGSLLSKFDVQDPEEIAVHPKTGEIYVAAREGWRYGPPKRTGPMSMGEYKRWKVRKEERYKQMPPVRPRVLYKFSAFSPDKPPRQLIRLEKGFDLIAIDPSAKEPRLWAVQNRRQVVPIRDLGDKFEVGKPINSYNGLKYPLYVTADPDNNRALIMDRGRRYAATAVDLETGKLSPFVSGISEIARAPDGTFVATAQAYKMGLLRFDANGKPLNWPGTDTHRAPTPKMSGLGHGFGQRGLCVAPDGHIYFYRNQNVNGVQNHVDVYTPDGKLKQKAIIDGMGIGDCGLGVDAAGNIYVGANVKPLDRLFPEALDGVVPKTPWLCWAQGQWGYRPEPWHYSMRNEYLYHIGAVFKFGPQGGKFYGQGELKSVPNPKASPLTNAANAPENAPEYRTGYLMQRVKVVGAEWRYPGMGLMPSSERQWGDPSCVCISSRLDVDPYGRVYLPDAFRFGVQITDSAGNRLGRVGEYGNADDRGPGIYFAWPSGIDYGPDGRLYVVDSVNTRLTVVDFDYADMRTVPVVDVKSDK
jgi:DNA-binding beta-propeller fold protein YncE